MSRFELKLPKMGESVAEATITSWLKEIGDKVALDEPILEIATDKVDSEVPSEVEGVLVEKLFKVDDLVKVGETIAILEVGGSGAVSGLVAKSEDSAISETEVVENLQKEIRKVEETISAISPVSGKFFSPLVKNIARAEGLSMAELEAIIGTGKDERVTKNDIFSYLANKNVGRTPEVAKSQVHLKESVTEAKAPVIRSGEDEVIEMTRMGKIIAKHMVESKQTSAHVQSFVEVDVTNIVKWRERIKDAFLKREGEKITYTPVFLQAVAKALKDFPMMNISVDGDKIIKRKAINLGMAAALADGNLIVPVIKNADALSLVGLTKAVNDLADRARTGKLNPDDIQGGTYTVTNVGSFGSIMGTPIISQPQVGILALGAIRKMPAVIETPDGDMIAIRHKMIISHSYDHRVVNGALGSMFAKKVADYLEAWDAKAEF
ncbi:MAG: dihydrolipoamide acetyltransferase family protein [Flavobacteriaceae bacterium]|nr:dihydrolipoamide acetyltransferase family protein [Flavobacteriaceae bacterium]